MATIREPVFGLDDFGKPKILNPSQSLANTLILILFGKPGFYPSIPELGMDISKYLYQFTDEISIDAIKGQLAYQCSLLKEPIANGAINVQLKTYNEQPLLLFTVAVDIYHPNTQLVIGVTLNATGNVIYNFKLMKLDFEN